MAITVAGGGCKPVGGAGKEKTEMAKRRKIRKKKMGLQDRYNHKVTLKLELLKGWAGRYTSLGFLSLNSQNLCTLKAIWAFTKLYFWFCVEHFYPTIIFFQWDKIIAFS